MRAEGAVANQESGIFDSLEFDGLLQGFDDTPSNFDLDLFPEPSVPDSDTLPHVIQASDLASADTCAERFQLDEAGVGHEDGLSGFFSAVFIDGPDSVRMDVETPKTYDGEVREKKSVGVPVGAGDEDDISVGKKIRRQMRNRESAMKSRERKKAHVKDLEVKSKYLESECRRLDYVLRCCMAENMVLHQSLQFQKERLYGASMSEQESAVLFVESLLLGSLLWLMSILCLFLVLCTLQYLNLEAIRIQGRRGLALQIVEVKNLRSEKSRPDSQLQFVSLRRRYICLRTRMKQLSFKLERDIVLFLV